MKLWYPTVGGSVVPVLLVREDIGVVTFEIMTPQSGRSVVQFLLVRVGIVFHVFVVRVDIGVVTYEVKTPQCGRLVILVLLSEWIKEG